MDATGDGGFDFGDRAFVWGSAPVHGDWNGNGKEKAGSFANGVWTLDWNGNGFFDAEDRVTAFGPAGGIPITGDWTGDGKTKIGVFYQGIFYLDSNGNGVPDAGDRIFSWGSAASIPVVGDWNGDGRAKIGVYEGGVWSLDINGTGMWDSGDRVFAWGTGIPSATPVVGDWNGDGRDKVGIYASGIWYLDTNGDTVFTPGDKIFGWGFPSRDIPVVGDWNGTGTDKVGVFFDGNWYLDVNGSTIFDAGDLAFPWGARGDLPVTGDWQPVAPPVLTQHNNNARDGLNAAECILNPANVRSSTFGKLFSHNVDGFIHAQPLYVPLIPMSNGLHNVVIVATEHDSVYAFDADTALGANANPLWHVSFINPAAGITTVSSAGDLGGCAQTGPEAGITGTPVIDASTGTIYVVAMTKEPNAQFVQRLHALDLATGAEKPGSPVVIDASAPGTGDGSNIVRFIPKNYKARPGLLLLNGIVYIGWSSHCDAGLYHGWLLGYDARTLQQVSVFNTTPNGQEASLWNSGAGIAADDRGNIFLSTANGDFNADTGGSNYGDSFVKLSAGSNPAVLGYFTPHDQDTMRLTDGDLGSGGIVLLPDSAGSSTHPHLMASAGKTGTIYLVDRDNLGGYNRNGPDHSIQSISGAIGGSFGSAAYFRGTLYYAGNGDPLKAFSLSGAFLSAQASTQSSGAFGYPGTTPSVSANGIENGIVWALQNAGNTVLHAYDASNLTIELYNSDLTGGRDVLGRFAGFGTPTITGGKVYVGTQTTLEVFGLLDR